MILAILIIGAVLLVAAIRNSQDALFTALGQDVPGYVVWAAAIIAIGMVGYVKGLKPVSQALLVLVFVALILSNNTWQNILAGFQSAQKSGVKAGGGTFGGQGVTGSWSSGDASTASSIAGGLNSLQLNSANLAQGAQVA